MSDIMVHNCNPKYLEAEAGRLQVLGQLGLHLELEFLNQEEILLFLGDEEERSMKWAEGVCS